MCVQTGHYIITQDDERLLCVSSRSTGWGSFIEVQDGTIYNMPLDGLKIDADQTTELPEKS